jgi:hypothetical protein
MNMKYIAALILKEFKEAFYSRKTILSVVGLYSFFLYLIFDSPELGSGTTTGPLLLTLLATLAGLGQFMHESILSDKRNQSLEVNLASGTILEVIIAKHLFIVLFSTLIASLFIILFAMRGVTYLSDPFIILTIFFSLWSGASSSAIAVLFLKEGRNSGMVALLAMAPPIGLALLPSYLNWTNAAIGPVLQLFLAYALFKVSHVLWTKPEFLLQVD